MSAARQKQKANRDKLRSERRLSKTLTPWALEIVNSYRIGDSIVSEDSIPLLKTALKQGYIAAAKDVLKFDIRQFKQLDVDEQILTDISKALNPRFELKSNLSTTEISGTSSKLVSRTTNLAVENQWSQREAKSTLANYLKSQKGTISMTESQWVVEATRNIAVMKIRSPLQNGIEDLIRLMEAGNMSDARKLSRVISKLNKLPASLNQADAIQTVSTLNLQQPIVHAENIVSLRRQAKRLDASMKEWQTLGDGDVRETHQGVNGQQQGIEAPFEVSGSLLQYPGDGSLGAGLNEIIRCRCATVYL